MSKIEDFFIGKGLLISCHITCLEGIVAYLKGEEWAKDLLTPEIIEKDVLSLIKFLQELKEATGVEYRQKIIDIINQSKEKAMQNLLKDMEGFEEEARDE